MKSPTTTLIKELTGSDQVVVIPVPFLKILGDSNAAMLLNQIIYWSKRTKDPNGWFYKSYEDWHQELYLSEYQIKRAIGGDKRRKSEMVTLTDLGVEAKLQYSTRAKKTLMHYRLDWDIFTNALIQFAETDLNNVQDTVLNIVKNGVPNKVQNTPPYNVQNAPRGTITENTSETTATENGALLLPAITMTRQRAMAHHDNLPTTSNSEVGAIEYTPVPESHTLTTDTSLAVAIKACEQHIGILTYYDLEKVKSATDEYPIAWILEAVELAKGKRWNYAEAILKRFQKEGQSDDDKRKAAEAQATARDAYDQQARARAAALDAELEDLRKAG